MKPGQTIFNLRRPHVWRYVVRVNKDGTLDTMRLDAKGWRFMTITRVYEWRLLRASSP